MAIGIDLTEDSGLNTKYHRISNISLNYIDNKSIIEIEEYTSDEYRNKTKEADEIRMSISNIIEQLNTIEDTELRKALEDKLYTLQNKNKDLLEHNYIAKIKRISLDFIPEDTTFTGFYNALKNLEEYKEASDV